MSCFTFEFGTPDSHFYHIPEGSVLYVRILSRGTTGDIYFLYDAPNLFDVPRAICEDLVAWMGADEPTIIKHEPRAMAKPIGWEGTFSEAVKAMKEGWKVRQECWRSGQHVLVIDGRIRTESGIAYVMGDASIFANDWELVDD